MKFYMLSDLHLGNNTKIDDAKDILSRLCSRIRASSPTSEILLFIIMGDLIHASKTSAFDDAKKCLDHICFELKEYNVNFEFVPGNHDIHEEDLVEFDKFITQYGARNMFSKKSTYSRIYDNVNFIFADSNLSRDYRKPGQLDISAIEKETKDMQNLLFCHHGFTHSYIGDHDTVENGHLVLSQLEKMNIGFAFHGHAHRSEATVSQAGISEIGCGTFLQDISDMDGVFNQFSVGYIRDGKVIYIERMLLTKDGGDGFAREALYPVQQTFADPGTIGKIKYPCVSNYISRKVLPHRSAISDAFERFFSGVKEIDLIEVFLKNEKILLLSDAGQGKSTELNNLACKLYETHLFPYLIRLKYYNGEPIQKLLTDEYRTLAPYRLAILFDGYDELGDNRSVFEKQLNLYAEKNSSVHILISSRSNFCKSEKDNKSRTFNNFDIYDLQTLKGMDVDEYLLSQGIDSETFRMEASSSGVLDLIQNPFYLTKLSDIFLKDEKLPLKSELMDKLIESCFESDEQKFCEDIEDRYRDLFYWLERISFAMQLMQQYVFDDRTVYQELFSLEIRNLVKYSGIFKIEGANWQFVHNNFREYLAAKYLSRLSKDEIISYVSCATGIKPSWLNTLGYLSGMNLDWDIVEWIANFSPNALVKIEHDRVDANIRFEILKRIFIKYEEKHLWFNDDLCDEEQLAYFSCSPEALTFLLDRIANPRHHISQFTAIQILRYFPKLFGRQDETLKCLLDCCYNYPETRSDLCRIAIKAIEQLNLNTPNITQVLMELFGESENDYIRLGIYEYLIATKELDDYVQFFLDGIPFIQHRLRSDENRIGNESFELINGLKSMSSYESVYSILEWYANNISVDFYDSQEVFSSVCEKAKEIYLNGKTEIFDAVFQCMVQATRNWNRKIEKDCIEFFESTDTLEISTLNLIEVFSSETFFLSDLFYTKPQTIDFVIKAYAFSTFSNHEAFQKIVQNYVEDESVYKKCQSLVLEISGEELPQRLPKIDHGSMRKESAQAFFNALFSLEDMRIMFNELMQAIGQDEITAKELLDKLKYFPYASPLRHLVSSIYHYLSEETKIKDFFAMINWERFVITETKRLLRQHPDLSVTQEQKNELWKTIKGHIEDGVLSNEVHSEKSSVSDFVDSLVFLIMHFEYQVEESILLEMTEIPAFCFNRDNFGKKYEYLKEQISLEKLKTRISKNISEKNLGEYILQDHIEFCHTFRSDVAVKKALLVCIEEKEDSMLKHVAVDYLYGICGYEYICDKVLPYATEDFLIHILTTYKDIPRERLYSYALEEYNLNPTTSLMGYLINSECEQALDDYVKKVLEQKRPPDYNGSDYLSPTKAIASISNPYFLTQLTQLLTVVLDSNFVDSQFGGLRNSLSDAFVNCGKVSADDTIALLECFLSGNQQKGEYCIRFCNFIIDEIERNKRKDTDRAMSIQETKSKIYS